MIRVCMLFVWMQATLCAGVSLRSGALQRSAIESCERVLVVVRHGQDGEFAPFPADVPDRIQDLKAEWYKLNGNGHATAMFLRDHLDDYLNSRGFCAVTKAEVRLGGTWNPFGTLSPWAALHEAESIEFKWRTKPSDTSATSSTAGSRIVVSVGEDLWAPKISAKDYPSEISHSSILARVYGGDVSRICMPSHPSHMFYVYRDYLAPTSDRPDGSWRTLEQRKYTPSGVSEETFECDQPNQIYA